MKTYYVESIIEEISKGIKTLINKGILTQDKKIILYGLDTFSFAMRTILSNLGFSTDSYISDDPELLIRFKRNIKSIGARYLNSTRDLIRICSIKERLSSFDSHIVILNASKGCPEEVLEQFNYRRGSNYFCVYDWEADEFLKALQGKRPMEIREVQSVLKEMLIQVDRFCLEKGLRYWVCGGTLLGTFRHKGFIPWDDDIDIFMPWEDYQRFLNEFTTDADHILIVSGAGDRKDYYELFSKLADHRTMVREDVDVVRKVHPVAMDIFPIIGMPDDAGERSLFFSRYYELEKQIWEDYYACNGDLDVYNRWYPAQKEFLEAYDFEQSAYVGVLASAYRERDCTTRGAYASTLRMPFEDIGVNVPCGYRESLDNMYGPDWMELPGEGSRKSHHKMEAYWL